MEWSNGSCQVPWYPDYVSQPKTSHMNVQKLEKLFKDYEMAFDKLDFRAIADHYGDSFMSAVPAGSAIMNKKEFLAMCEQASDRYRELGQNSGRILSKKIIPISNEYAMVTVHWGATYTKTGSQVIEFDVSYIVQEINDDQKVILFISHKDEEATLRNLGLLTKE
jgi:hypothetical protein